MKTFKTLLLAFILLIVLVVGVYQIGKRNREEGTGYERIKKEISTDSVFEYEEASPESVKGSKGIYTLVATGDVILARSVNFKTVAQNNFNLPFETTADFLRSADITFINLEAPMVKNCPLTVEGMIFCGDERNVEGLVFAGVDVVTVANNHFGNYGIDGITNTVKILKENSISVTGNEQPAVLRVRGKKFGFLGYNAIGGRGEGVAWADPEKVEVDIRSLKKKVDFVVVAFHWGVEYTSSPTSYQIELAHLAVDSGADLIIGNHPHWVQAVEKYNDKFITYAHGNFVFDQMWSRRTREGVLGKYVFGDKELIDVKFYPIIVEDYSQPRFADEDEAKIILERMKQVSLKLVE